MFFEYIRTLVVYTYAVEILTRRSTSKFRERVRVRTEFKTFFPLIEVKFCHNIFLLRKSTRKRRAKYVQANYMLFLCRMIFIIEL